MNSRLIGLAKDALLLNLGRGLPFRVTLMISERCPLRCTTCSIWRTTDPREPSIDELESFFAANGHISWLNFTGGEIFMRRDLDDLFRTTARMLRRLAVVNFPTAGQEPDLIASQVDAGLAAGLRRVVVTVSFDGGRREHDRLRRRTGAFDRAAATWRNLKELSARSRGRLSVFAGMTLSEELMALTPEPLDALVRDLDLEGTGEIHINLAHASEHYYRTHPADPLPSDAVGAILQKALAGRSGTGTGLRHGGVNLLEKIYLGCAHDYLLSHASPLPCKALRCSLFVDADLGVYPCTVFNRSLGNLRDSGYSIAALRQSALWRDTVKEIKAGQCPGCWTPCEAYPSVIGNLLRPGVLKIARHLTGSRRRT